MSFHAIGARVKIVDEQSMFFGRNGAISYDYGDGRYDVYTDGGSTTSVLGHLLSSLGQEGNPMSQRLFTVTTAVVQSRNEKTGAIEEIGATDQSFAVGGSPQEVTRNAYVALARENEEADPADFLINVQEIQMSTPL